LGLLLNADTSIMKLRLRPQSDYLYQAKWEALYILAEHWKSDMEFYTDELQFLKGLIDKYFILLIKDDGIQHIQALTSKLSASEQELTQLTSGIKRHLHHLEELIENSFVYDQEVFRKEHAQLEDDITKFTESFKLLKKDIFLVTKQLLEEKKIKQLISTK